MFGSIEESELRKKVKKVFMRVIVKMFAQTYKYIPEGSQGDS